MLHVEWYHVCWPRLTAKCVEPVVSISWASCLSCHVLKSTKTARQGDYPFILHSTLWTWTNIPTVSFRSATLYTTTTTTTTTTTFGFCLNIVYFEVKQGASEVSQGRTFGHCYCKIFCRPMSFLSHNQQCQSTEECKMYKENASKLTVNKLRH